jgi:proteic killer suppression protein
MLVVFADKDLEKLVGDRRKLERKYGRLMAVKIETRLSVLYSVSDIQELKLFAGRFHELKGDRIGQWACDLEQPYRLIFRPVLGEIEIKCVEIVEIVDYH